MVIFLLLLSWICWVVVYIQLIYEGFKFNTYGMPIFALALNLVWEAIYFYMSIKNNFASLQGWLILIWFLLDIVVFFTYLRYGSKYFPKHINQDYFKWWNIIIFLMAITVQCSFIKAFGNEAILYSAFMQNLLMSVSFINLLYIRKNTKGQNLTIAFSKWIGTLLPTIVYGVIYSNQLCLILGIFCSVFDIMYIYYLKNFIKSTY